jgi:hypothetical protein
MMTLFLPTAAARASLVRPAQASIDMHAACFCHRRRVDVAFVCSVCLSVFCELKSTCDTCGARVPRRDRSRVAVRGGAAGVGAGAAPAGPVAAGGAGT